MCHITPSFCNYIFVWLTAKLHSVTQQTRLDGMRDSAAAEGIQAKFAYFVAGEKPNSI